MLFQCVVGHVYTYVRECDTSYFGVAMFSENTSYTKKCVEKCTWVENQQSSSCLSFSFTLKPVDHNRFFLILEKVLLLLGLAIKHMS